jgi:hypothetical protein
VEGQLTDAKLVARYMRKRERPFSAQFTSEVVRFDLNVHGLGV